MVERSEEHTSELQSQSNLVCRLLLEKKKNLNFLYCPDQLRTHHLDHLPRLPVSSINNHPRVRLSACIFPALIQYAQSSTYSPPTIRIAVRLHRRRSSEKLAADASGSRTVDVNSALIPQDVADVKNG